jgi:NADPH:quinone reductase-like Zn-dependent oxidoreductase
MLHSRVTFSSYGDSSVLKMSSLPYPTAQPNEVLVRGKGAAISIGDTIMLSGAGRALFPIDMPSPGYALDFSGTVEAVGRDVTSFKVGDLVVGSLEVQRPGALSEVLAVEESRCALVPEALRGSLALLAGLPVSGTTAWDAVRRSKAASGDRVLVNGGSGGVAHFVVQILKNVVGAHVVATASPEKADFVKSLGADEVLNYKDPKALSSLEPRSFDCIIDTVGNHSALLPLIKPGTGKPFVAVAGPPLPWSFDGTPFELSGVKGALFRSVMTLWSAPARFAAYRAGTEYHGFLSLASGESIKELIRLVKDGKLEVRPDGGRVRAGMLDIAVVKEANDRVSSGRATGKVIVGEE